MAQIKQYTGAELMRIAMRQKVVRRLIVVNLLTIWIPFASIFMGMIGFPFIYRLGKALRSSATWLFVAAAIIPVVDLVGLLILNRIVTVALGQHQIRVGLTEQGKKICLN